MLLAPALLPAQDAADSSWSNGDVRTAEVLYAVRLSHDSTDDRALHRLALIRAWDHHYDQSLALFDRLLSLSPANREAAVDRARVLAWAGRYREAVAVYDSLLSSNPADREALLGVAQVLAWSGELDSAQRVYRWVLDHHADDREALRGQARVSAWRGDLLVAEQRWRDLIAADSEDAQSYLGLARALRWRGRTAAAVAVLERASRLAPDDDAVLQEMEWVRLMMRPRVRSELTNESDTDDNDITTVTVAGGWRPAPVIELSGEAYGRTASVANAFRRHSYGAVGYGSYEMEPGWLLKGGLGLVGSDGTSSSPLLRLLAMVTTPAKSRGGASLSYSRRPLDLTAGLIERGVWTQGLFATGHYQLGDRTRLAAGASVTWFQGGETNRRLSAEASAWRLVAASWTLGGTVRTFGFQKNLQEGYFDPDSYWLGEAVVGWRPRAGVWKFEFVVAPGLQQVGSGGSVEVAGRAVAQVSYGIAPGRDVGVFVRASSAGMDGFSTASADYRNLVIGVSGSWLF